MEDQSQGERTVSVNVAARAGKSRVGPPVKAVAISIAEARRYAKPCVYFLMLADVCTYVGKSMWLPGRMSKHAGVHDFDSVRVFPAPTEALAELERRWIATLMPSGNRHGKSPSLIRGPKGRPPRPGGRLVSLTIRVDAKDIERWKKLAEARGMLVGEYVRTTVSAAKGKK